MSRSDIIIKLMRDKGWTLDEAEEFLSDIPENDPATPEAARARQAWEAGDTFQVRRGGPESNKDAPASRFIVAQRGPNGLTATQQAGVDRGEKLCPNCHEPEDAHVPACLRDKKNGFEGKVRRKAITRGILPPSS